MQVKHLYCSLQKVWGSTPVTHPRTAWALNTWSPNTSPPWDSEARGIDASMLKLPLLAGPRITVSCSIYETGRLACLLTGVARARSLHRPRCPLLRNGLLLYFNTLGRSWPAYLNNVDTDIAGYNTVTIFKRLSNLKVSFIPVPNSYLLKG